MDRRHIPALILLSVGIATIKCDDVSEPSSTDSALKFSHSVAAVTPTPTSAHLLTCAQDENLLLTPFWDLVFGEGEQVLVDCGYCSGGNTDGIQLTWSTNASNEISNTHRYA